MFGRWFVVLVVASTAVLAVSAKSAPSSESLRNISVVKDIREFARKHPGLTLMRLNKVSSQERSQSVRYSLGGRVSGDRLVAQASDVFNYPAKKNVAIQLTYPEAGLGSIVTYVEVICQQDSQDGNAYVVAGGIGQRFISIMVEANETETFSYQASYYGSN